MRKKNQARAAVTALFGSAAPVSASAPISVHFEGDVHVHQYGGIPPGSPELQNLIALLRGLDREQLHQVGQFAAKMKR